MEEPIDERYAAAVAAATLAVSSQAQKKYSQLDKIQPTKAHNNLNKPKIRKENTMDRGIISRWLSIKEDKSGRDSNDFHYFLKEIIEAANKRVRDRG